MTPQDLDDTARTQPDSDNTAGTQPDLDDTARTQPDLVDTARTQTENLMTQPNLDDTARKLDDAARIDAENAWVVTDSRTHATHAPPPRECDKVQVCLAVNRRHAHEK